MATNKLTLLQKLDIPIAFIQGLLSTLISAVAAPFRGPNTPKTLGRHLLLTLGRNVITRLSTQQLQSLVGTTESNYLAWTRSHNLKPQSIDLPGLDTKAFWLGDPKAENTVLYFHGGGWAMPGTDAHFQFSTSLMAAAEKDGKEIAVLFLQYDLAPAAQYPRQLEQAVELLRYATTTLQRAPEKIMLMGDSAGGNMVLGVLSHLLHPQPMIRPLKLGGPVKGAVSCSPVTVMNADNERFRTHESQDPASAETIRVWLTNFLGSNKPDNWNEPLNAGVKWWSGLGDVVQGVLITVASNEMMAADTIACAEKIKTGFKDTTLFKSEIDFHAQPGIGPSMGMGPGETSQVIIEWILERC